MKKLLSILLLLGLFTLLPGCSCNREDSEKIIEPEKVVEETPTPLQETFVGPTTEPFSNGPSQMPPSE